MKREHLAGVSESVRFLMTGGDDQYRRLKEQIKEQRTLLKLLPFLFSLVLWINKKTNYNQTHCNNTNYYTHKNRKTFKEITCQSNNQRCFSQIGYLSGDKFLAAFIGLHYFEDSINFKFCQVENSQRGR